MSSRCLLMLRCVCLAGIFGGMTLTLPGQAPRGKQQLHESLLLDVDNAATKKFATVQTHLRVGQLTEAIELLRNISDTHAGKLVATTSGRYVNVQDYVQMLSAGLSPEGLRIYRAQLDPLLKPRFEAAREAADEVQLLKVLQQGYCCSFADDALLLLGNLAWDDGDVWRARSYWVQLLPAPRPKELGEPVAWLAYPDTDLDLGQIVARIILCSIHTGNRGEIQHELSGFAERYPEAKGHLAGREGNLLQILRDVARESESWTAPLETSVVETFAGSPQRFHIDSPAGDLGTLRWQASLRTFGEAPRRGFQQGALGGVCYFPVVYGDVVLVNDDEYIYAYRLQTGQPAWSDETKDARIYISGFANQEIAQQRPFGEGLIGNIGLPRFTMTVADGRLYARMGSVQPYSNSRGGLLVCLDLAKGEGKPVWETFASSLDPEVGGWIFEGSPLVIGSRLYVGMRRMNPQPQSNIACFDALTGKLIWNRKLCVGQTNPNFNDFDINQHLLTWGAGTLYYTTHMGAVAAVDPRSGTIKWIVSYPRVDDTKQRHELNARLQRGPLPALFADGTLYVAPLDSDELMAFDAETGLIKWRRTFNRPIQSLLGVANGTLFVSGAELWAVATETGRITWKLGDPDPESHGFGRGLLVDDAIYWPTHEEIFVVAQETGAIRQRFPLFALNGQYGGNLVLAENHLLVAQPNRLAVFSDHGPVPRRLPAGKPDFSWREPAAREPWRLARQFVELQDWGRAVEQYQAVRQVARDDDEWMGQSLAQVAAQREVDARLRQAWNWTKSDPTAATNAVQQAIDTAAAMLPGQSANRRGAVDLVGFDQAGPVTKVRLPGAVPREMALWITDQLKVRLESSAHEGPGVPVLEQAIDSQAVDRQIVTTRRVGESDAAHVLERLKLAEKQADPAVRWRELRQVAQWLPTPEERARVWCEVARGLESQQAWSAAAAAWERALKVAPADYRVDDPAGAQPIADLVRERLEQPEYMRQSVLSSQASIPWPLRRHWERSAGIRGRPVYPEGTPPSVETACVLVDEPPLTCINLSDGTSRWKVNLSHPLSWAAFVAQQLVLATEVEVRAVSIADGRTIWWQRLGGGGNSGMSVPRELIALQALPSRLRTTGDRGAQGLASQEPFVEFATSGETLIARQGDRHLVAWDAGNGDLVWQFRAVRGLSPGWGVTERHVVLGQLSPPGLLVLDRTDGAVVSHWATDAAHWMRPPTLREDGTLMTVGPLGRIESWSAPGAAWQTEEGPRAWLWHGAISQSNFYPELLSCGRVSLLLMDGKILTGVDSLLGNQLWKVPLGQSLVADGRGAIASDPGQGQIYVASEGILRAFALTNGELQWESYLGSPHLDWKVHLQGTTLMAYPGQTDGDAPITVCAASNGNYLQRIAVTPGLPAAGAREVQVYPTAHTTVVACGGRLFGLAKP